MATGIEAALVPPLGQRAGSTHRSDRRAMSGVVLLRDFGYGIPKDLRVTFADKLPEEALCIQCDNVSARLYRDACGHGYCTSCRAMCERDGFFECATCRKKYKAWELTLDCSAPDTIKKAKIICPKTSPDKPVLITFSALKAHLKSCVCSVAKEVTESDIQSSGLAMLPRLPEKQESAVHPPGRQEENMGSKRGTCEGFKHTRHDSSSDLSASLPVEKSRSHQVFMTGPVNELTGEHAGSLNGGMCTTRKEPPVSPADPSDLPRLLNVALSKMCDLEQEVTELKNAADKRNDDTDLLKVAVPTIQGDMRNVQIQCEQRIEKSEKSISNVEESHSSLQETVSIINEDTKTRLNAVEEAMKSMDERLSFAVHQLQEENKKVYGALDHIFRDLHQMKMDFHEFVKDYYQAQELAIATKGHGRSK
ncbi:uncharacterized protein LOC119464227 isoform X4 [Dermacentor silvarum]|uniref:uncharacterized protein LOC119464227 isoform X4 n=1 Tax=Dermacentor silvarum TaxID=543639 RepID=UPI00189BA089|nr:uncharacterized protein LOC119464227 isoform X4 [Dermacentor silvarum]